MVVLAPGPDTGAPATPADILEGAPTLLPVLAHNAVNRSGGGQELEFTLRGLMDLRMEVEELRRRLDERLGRVQVIEVPESAISPIQIEPAQPAPQPEVLYRSGMTMADVERATIAAALQECQGNRR